VIRLRGGLLMPNDEQRQREHQPEYWNQEAAPEQTRRIGRKPRSRCAQMGTRQRGVTREAKAIQRPCGEGVEPFVQLADHALRQLPLVHSVTPFALRNTARAWAAREQ